MNDIPSNIFYNIEAEKALIGALLINNEIFDEISEIINYEYFYIDSHKHIFKLCNLLIEKGQIAEAITISQLVALDEKYKNIISYDYLIDLSSNFINYSSVKDYAYIIKDLHLKRELLKLTTTINNSLNSNETANLTISTAEESLYNLAETSLISKDVKDFASSLQLAFENAENAKKQSGISGLPTHLIDIDNKLGGLQKSDLLILAGRPSMGKTALAINIAFNVAYTNKETVLVFSLEMSAEQLATRILSQQTRIKSNQIRTGSIKDADLKTLSQAIIDFKNTPIFIDDSPNITIDILRAKCRRFKRKHNLKLIVIDYIQLMHSNKKTDNRVLEISEITRGLKAIAKEFNIPVIALSQLSRAVESRDDKRPMLSDLRESGSIEQDADIVFFIYREAYYLSREEPIVTTGEKNSNSKWVEWKSKVDKVENIATVILAKNRHGSIGNINLYFKPEFTEFGNLGKQ